MEHRGTGGQGQGAEKGKLRVLAVIREVRFPRDQPRQCPRCKSPRTIRWGRTRGRQRYRCHGCHRTFGPLTGTPLAYSKRLDRWPGFGACMALGLSVRAAARRLGIDKDTAFRWRHRLAEVYDARRKGPVGGMVAVSVAPLAHSEKGRRPKDRPARKRRGRVLDPRVRRVVNVVFLGSETGSAWSFVALEGTRALFPHPLEAVRKLGPWLRPGSRLVATSRLEDVGRFAWLTGHELWDARGQRHDPERLLGEVQCWVLRARLERVRADGGTAAEGLPAAAEPGAAEGTAASRDRGEGIDAAERRELQAERARGLALVNEACRRSWTFWLRRFRGVASRYLRSYLAWHRQLHLCIAGEGGQGPPTARNPSGSEAWSPRQGSDNPWAWPMLAAALR